MNLLRNSLCFFRYFRNYLVAVSTCVSNKWPRHIVNLRNKNTFARFFAKIAKIVYLIIYFENLGTATFKKQFTKPSFQLCSNLWKPSSGLQSQLLDRIRSPVETAGNRYGLITVKYNLLTNLIHNKFYRRCPTNLIHNKFYRRCSTKGTEQCSFVKRLLILIARKHKKISPFIEKLVNCNCLLVYGNLYDLL